MVFNFHFLFTYTHKTMMGWGLGGENWGIHQLPIIHMVISGHVMVTIFFVISGYVLSHKPLKLLHSNSWERAFHTLASSTFRRGFRLYLPSIAGLFCVLVAVRLGLFHYSTMVREEGSTIRGINEQHPPIYHSLGRQIFDWYLTVVHLMDPWNWNLFYNSYNPHLWTIPVEFRCSILLFLTLLTTSKLRPRSRLCSVFALILFCVRWGRWDVVLFLSGLMLAEIDLLCGLWDSIPSHVAISRRGHRQIDYRPRGPSASNRRSLWLFIFVVGLYIASSPNSAPSKTPGYRLLSLLTPRTYPEPHRFLQTIGAIIIVASINHSPALQRAFTNSVAQYLGRISFAFYIVHGPILHSLGYSLMPNIWLITGKETDAQFCFGLLIGYAICLPVSIWAADMFWRGVDVPSVKFSRWLEHRLFAQSVSSDLPIAKESYRMRATVSQ
jgi:peptidoglycan/LPS O-acetylase OafA/YrhL